jgi:multimeric flavodoxin WrbA
MEELKSAGIECEYEWIGKEKLQGCIACYKCRENNDQKCAIDGDKMNYYIQKMLEADGIIIGSPTYFSDLTVATKALIERAGFATYGGGLKNKVGAAVVAVRRAGANHVFSSINYFFLIKEMIVVGSTYWNMGIGRTPGEVLNDAEGIHTFKNLGKNIAYVLKKLKT